MQRGDNISQTSQLFTVNLTTNQPVDGQQIILKEQLDILFPIIYTEYKFTLSTFITEQINRTSRFSFFEEMYSGKP
jgi:hypothetical protein